jgi:hypothetical protein
MRDSGVDYSEELLSRVVFRRAELGGVLQDSIGESFTYRN